MISDTSTSTSTSVARGSASVSAVVGEVGVPPVTGD
jgi:hypothetical protein